MKKKRAKLGISVLLVSALLFSFSQQVFAQAPGALTNLIQTVYNDQNGLPTSEANTVLQTSDGYIWIGGYGGLVRYDGREFLNYCAKGKLATSGIRALFEDSRGRLWIGTNDKGVFLYEDGVFTACTIAQEDMYRSIRCFAEDASGTVYVGSSVGLAKIDGENRISPASVEKLDGQTIYSLSFDQNNVLWGTAGSGFAFAVKDGELAYWLKPGDLNEAENYTVLAHENVIYIGTSKSALLQLTLTDGNYTEGSYRLHTYDTGVLQTANALYLTREGDLWLGCNTGSGWFDKEMMFHILDNMEQNTFLSCITQDYEGNLWLASTQGGVFQLAKGKFLNANKAAGLEGKSVNTVVKLDGLLYAASDYGLCIADESWSPVSNRLTEMLDGVRIRHLYVDSSQNLWISTYGELALLRYTPATESLLSITEADGLLSNKVRNVIELKNGDMAVATTEGICILRDSKVVQCYGKEQGLDNPMILCLMQAADGTLLAGSDGMGIYAMKDGKVSNTSMEQGLDAGVVLRMREDEKAGGVWISAGSGLYFMDAQGGIREIKEFHYGIGSVFDILVMEDDIWLLKSSGLIIVPRASLLGRQEMTAVQYGRESGLSNSVTANSWSLFENGILYLCTVNGVFLLDYEHITPDDILPKIAIDEVTVQQDSGKTTVYHNPSSLTLPSDTRRITFRFACLSFANAPGVVSYYLENFDGQPIVIPADQTEAVSYTNLRGGNYVFHVNAGNRFGVMGETTRSIAIQKEPRLWEQPAVQIGLAALAVLFIVLFANLVLEYKTRKLVRRQQEYKEITDQALKTIANTIDAKDAYTKGHAVRVAGYSRELARRLGLPENEQEHIYYIALLHDIGKIGIPDAILNKPGKLTAEEYEIMQAHTLIGSDILKDFTALPQIGDGALSHHENYDGSGYPYHKRSGETPFVAQIIRAADSYDAMATKRAYRDAMSQEYILSEFQKFSGIQFEPHIAQVMIDMITSGFTLQETELQR